jgi:hypothetical protein
MLDREYHVIPEFIALHLRCVHFVSETRTVWKGGENKHWTAYRQRCYPGRGCATLRVHYTLHLVDVYLYVFFTDTVHSNIAGKFNKR